MEKIIYILEIIILFMNFMMLNSSRVRICVTIMSIQSVLITIFPLFFNLNNIPLEFFFFLILNILLKGVIFPYLLLRALREANIKKEVEPIGGYPLSLVIGVILLVISLWISKKIVGFYNSGFYLAVAISFFTIFTGSLMILTRVKAITQVVGYLVLENGIYYFANLFLKKQSFLVEIAILLDVFVAVFVMGIAIFHINREFNHIDTEKLTFLKDYIENEEE